MKKFTLTILTLFSLIFINIESIFADTLTMDDKPVINIKTEAETAKQVVKSSAKSNVGLIILVVFAVIIVLAAIAFIAIVMTKKYKNKNSSSQNKFSENHVVERKCKVILTRNNNESVVYKMDFSENIDYAKATLGRGIGKKIEVVIEDDTAVSNVHCEFVKKGKLFFVNDLNSTNGTKKNDEPIYEETAIISGDKLTIGNYIYTIKIEYGS